MRILSAPLSHWIESTPKVNMLDDMQNNNSAQDHARYLTFGQESIGKVLSREDGSDGVTTWAEVKSTSDGIKVLRGTVVGDSWNAMKSIAKIRCSAEKLAELLNDSARMTEFDEMTDNCRVIDDIDLASGTSIRYVQAKPVFPTSARDFLVVTSEQRMDNKIVIATRSIQLDQVPEMKSFVRAHTHISGYIIKPISATECELTLVVHMDLGGYLPAPVINFLGTSAPIKLMHKLRKICEH